MDMMYPLKLILSLSLGSFIGLEREYHKEETRNKKRAFSSLGVRTFSLLTLLGSISGIIFNEYPVLSLVLASSVMILILSNYVLGTIQTKDSGITTEIAGIFAFTVGLIVSLEIFPIQLTVALTVIATLILSRKDEIKNTVAKLHEFETNAFITYGLLALVILPFLPNRSFSISDIPVLSSFLSAYNIQPGILRSLEIINPYKLWFLVVLITGIDLLGYFLTKYFGKNKGFILSAVAGGFVSSTATTIALAQNSRRSVMTNQLVGAAILANTASFFQLIALLAATNGTLLNRSTIPILSIILGGIISGFVFLRAGKPESLKKVRTKISTQVFSVRSAMKFALIFLFVRFGSNLSLAVIGTSGIFITSAIGALVGIDAVTLSLSELASQGKISLDSGLIALLVANAVNLSAKSVYSYIQGSRHFANKFSISMAFIIAASIVGALFGNPELK